MVNQKDRQPMRRMVACCERVAAMNFPQVRWLAPAKQQPKQERQKSQARGEALRLGCLLRVPPLLDGKLRAAELPAEAERDPLPIAEPAGTDGGDARDISASRRA
jgi:hypothetical protein